MARLLHCAAALGRYQCEQYNISNNVKVLLVECLTCPALTTIRPLPIPCMISDIRVSNLSMETTPYTMQSACVMEDGAAQPPVVQVDLEISLHHTFAW